MRTNFAKIGKRPSNTRNPNLYKKNSKVIVSDMSQIHLYTLLFNDIINNDPFRGPYGVLKLSQETLRVHRVKFFSPRNSIFVFEKVFFEMNVVVFLIFLFTITNAYYIVPISWNRRRNLKGKKREHNNFLDALKRSMSYSMRNSAIITCIGIECMLLIHFWGGLFWTFWGTWKLDVVIFRAFGPKILEIFI